MGFIVLVIAHVSTAWRDVKLAGTDEDQLGALALLSAFLAFVVFAMTSPFLFQQYGWLAGVLVVAWSLRRDALTASSPSAVRGYRPMHAQATPG